MNEVQPTDFRPTELQDPLGVKASVKGTAVLLLIKTIDELLSL